MGLFDKIKNGINPESDLGYEDVDPYTDQIQDDFNNTQMYGQTQQYGAQDPYGAQDDGLQVSGSSLDIKVIKPERFDSASQIANHLLNRRTVVLNLEATNKETARRLLDFLSGVAYSINGGIKRVANNTYVITPCNVDVSEGALQDKRQKENTSEYYENEI
ncbi:MAG: cell division protein SepF [Clostridia bacterium]|nr:cell division protein SepF [Clostridia bacterium]